MRATWALAVLLSLGILKTQAGELPEPPTVFQGGTKAFLQSPVPDFGPPSFEWDVQLPENRDKHDRLILTSQDIDATLGGKELQKNGASTNGATNGKKNGNGDADEPEDPPAHISDNSFLIEEAYNQEPGVVQHIFTYTGLWSNRGGRFRSFGFTQTMELPFFSQRHQLSFDFPFDEFYELPDGGVVTETGGIGDMSFNYRYGLLFEDPCGWKPAVAPRFTAIVPTGDAGRGLGVGALGYEFNLPVSKQWEPFAFHFNAGFNVFPDVSVPLGGGVFSPGEDLWSYGVGGSVIYLMNYNFNLLLEAVVSWNDDFNDAGVVETTTEAFLNPGFRWAVYTGDEIQFVLGAAAPIGLTNDSPEYGFFGYLSVEHRFRKVEEEEEACCEYYFGE